MKNLKRFLFIIILFIIFFIVTARSYANTISKDLSNTFFRLHILANSDSLEDQELKLKVRDAILEYMNTLSYDNISKEKAIKLSEEHIEDFKKTAEKVIKENGYNYDVKIQIGNFYFPTKIYGNISLPAGNYDALKIEIGNAQGKNWWCSLFPPLCFVDISTGVIDEESEKYLRENLTTEEFTVISTNTDEIRLKFKIIELLNEKNIL